MDGWMWDVEWMMRKWREYQGNMMMRGAIRRWGEKSARRKEALYI